MKEDLKLSFKRAFSDRPFMAVLASVLVAGIVYALVIGFSIHAVDVQVYTRYTAFGEAHFYKNPWQYTIMFALFGVFVSIVHGALMVKFYSLNRRQTALMLGGIALAIIFVSAVYSLSIMRLAFR